MCIRDSISTGSLYLCAAGFLPLGLPVEEYRPASSQENLPDIE